MLFEAAFHLSFNELRRNLRTIWLLVAHPLGHSGGVAEPGGEYLLACTSRQRGADRLAACALLGGLRGAIALALAPESTDESWARQVLGGPIAPKVSQLMMAMIQAQDLEDATYALTLRGIPSTVVRSSGGFFDQRNHVLFVIDAAHYDQL